MVGPLESRPDGVWIRVKVVPGAARDQIAGLLGDRLKVRVSAPPEAGKANRRLCEVLGEALGVRVSDVSVISGQASPEKTVCVQGRLVEQVRERLGL